MDDLTEEARKVLEGVTPGPWHVCETTIHGVKYGGCWVEGPEVDDGDGRIHGLLIPISGSGGARSYTTRLVDRQDHDHNDANARFIAWTREGVPALLARLEAVEAKLARIEKAWPLVRDADCSGGELIWASEEIDAAMQGEG